MERSMGTWENENIEMDGWHKFWHRKKQYRFLMHT